MGGTGSGGHANSGPKSKAAKERAIAEKNGLTLVHMWSNHNRTASESGLQDHLNHNATSNSSASEENRPEQNESNAQIVPKVLLVSNNAEVATDDCDEEEVEEESKENEEEDEAIGSSGSSSQENNPDDFVNESSDKNVPAFIISLVEVIKRNFESKTGFYNEVKKGNFFIKSSNPLVKLKISNNSMFPDSFFAKDLFIWCPMTAFSEFSFYCIKPSCPGTLKFDGWPTDPCARRVYALGKSYFIVAHQYSCRECGKKFLSTNSEFLKSLPQYIQDNFPAWLTHRAGIDKDFLNYIYGQAGEGTSITVIRNALKEQLYLNYDRSRYQYYTYCRDFILGCKQKSSGSLFLNLKETIYVHKFGSFSSKSGYNEIVPSTKYLISLIKKKHDTLRPWYDNRVSLLSSSHLKIDHSHKVTGRIRFQDVKIFSGLFTAMNENNQIRL
jgi:hypothetical protein